MDESRHLLVHGPRPSTGRRRAAPRPLVPIAAVVVVTALSIAHVVAPDGLIGNLSSLPVTVGAGLVSVVGAARRGGTIRWLLAIGAALSSLGDLTWETLAYVLNREPDVSVADGPWVAAYVALALAILLLMRRTRPDRGVDVDGIIDMSVTALASGLILWHFWLDPLFSDSSVSLFDRSVWAAYPMLDIAMLALVVRMLIQRRSNDIAGVLLAGGLVCWLFSDLVFFTSAPTGLLGDLLDVGWMVGAALLAGACWNHADAPPAERSVAGDVPRLGKARITLVFAPLAVPAVIDLTTHVRHEEDNPIPLAIGTVVLIALAAVRAFRLLRHRDLAEERLASSARLYRALAANASDAVVMLDARGHILNDSPHLAELVGYPGEPTQGRRALDFVATDDTQSEHLFKETLLSPGAVLAGECHVSHPGAPDLWLATRAVNLLHDPDVRAIVVNVHDITDRKRAEEDLVHQAFHDSLSGLANRALFRDRVEHALVRRERSGSDPAVIYLDLDGFKHVNDGLGHEAGDNLLREVGARLQTIVRTGDTVARLGGDEFAILVEHSSYAQIETEAVAQRVLQMLSSPIDVGGREVTLSASLGIALADDDSTASQLLRDADIAMYQAKTTGKARWVLYDPSMRATAIGRLQLENDMAGAIAKDQLRLVYQPVVELLTDRIVGFEALLRWEHPELGTVVPDRFIPIAEENGLIIPIGEWVLEQACATAARWIDHHRIPLTMAVNVSACQLLAPDLVDQVRRALHGAGLEPKALVLELTESILVKDPELAASRLCELHSLGVRLAIDDFGTGFSSLTYLRQFPVDILKIDQSFVATIHESEKVPAIVRGLLELGRTLNLETVAEGVELAVQRDQLRDERCDFGQGFLFARPLPADEAERLLETFAAAQVPAAAVHGH